MEEHKEIERKVDDTIINLCNWIDTELKNVSSVHTENILPKMVESLAKLIAVRTCKSNY